MSSCLMCFLLYSSVKVQENHVCTWGGEKSLCVGGKIPFQSIWFILLQISTICFCVYLYTISISTDIKVVYHDFGLCRILKWFAVINRSMWSQCKRMLVSCWGNLKQPSTWFIFCHNMMWSVGWAQFKWLLGLSHSTVLSHNGTWNKRKTSVLLILFLLKILTFCSS
jgi:hypothetical protein